MASARWLWLLHALLEGGGRVSARRPRYLFFASPKKSTQKKGDPAARVPSLRCGQPAMLAPGVHRGTRCVRPSGELRSNIRGESDNDARVLRHALTPGPALLGTVRRGGERAPHGPLLRSACGPSLRSARQGGHAARRQRGARTDTRRSCESSSRVVPAPHPFWLRREAQELGWVRMPKDTRTSSSGLPQLFERSSKNAASSAAPPQIRASQVARSEAQGRRLGAAFSLVTFSWRPKRKLLRRRAHIPAPALNTRTEATTAQCVNAIRSPTEWLQ
jgi:hypothetical protein